MIKLVILFTIILFSTCNKENNRNDINHNDTNTNYVIDEEVLGICDSAIFKSVKEKGFVRIIIYLHADNLSADEDKKKEEVEKILDEFIELLEGLNIQDISKSRTGMLWLVLSADVEALIFICNHKQVRKVEIDELLAPFISMYNLNKFDL